MIQAAESYEMSVSFYRTAFARKQQFFTHIYYQSIHNTRYICTYISARTHARTHTHTHTHTHRVHTSLFRAKCWSHSINMIAVG